MAGFVKGDVVVLPFPYSDLSQAKRRPALIVGFSSGPDIILCQITSQAVADGDALPLNIWDFTSSRIVLYQVGTLRQSVVDNVVRKTIEILQR